MSRTPIKLVASRLSSPPKPAQPMRKRGTLAEFSAIALGEESPQTRPPVPDSLAPTQQISRVFSMQSYFDSTLLEKAILEQRPNEPIVFSTKKEEQLSGYAIGLHPSSETPVAIQFKVGGQPTSSQPLVLTPGQVLRPHGLPRGVKSGAFSGFSWGLPFGWLGGGLATLYVLQTPDAKLDWHERPEVAFHRTRMQIVAPGSIPATAAYNWPRRFPWTQALQGASSVPQSGSPVVAVSSPTRVLMRLRMTTLAAPATMRVLFQSSNEFGDVGFVDVPWAAFSGSGGVLTEYPVQEISTVLDRIGADDGGVVLADMTGTLAGNYVDVVRFGRL